MPPTVTVGDLKHEVQTKLGQGLDPDQVLVLDNQVLSNSMRVRNFLEQASGNLKLIDVEMLITVKASSSKTFPVKLHPGKAKVHDLMEQIERELDVPSGDQKLYLGRALLSDAPWKGLPRELICNPQPTVDVIVPEYIDITVQDQNGDSHIVKIDKEKSLEALVEEIPWCSSLQENEEAMFLFGSKPLRPSKDKGTLTSLGLNSGSKLELKVDISFLEIFVYVWFSNDAISIRCSPQETFKDLVKKVEIMEGRRRNLEKVTFAIDGRVFDPEKDKGSLLDYGVKHRSQLQMRDVGPTPEVSGDDSKIPPGSESVKEYGDRLEKQLLELKDLAESLDQCVVAQNSQLDSVKETKEKKSFLGSIRSKFWHGKQDKRIRKSEEISDKWEQDTYNIPESTGRPPPPPPPPALFGEEIGRVTEPDPAWRAGGTTLQGYSTQQFMIAQPIKVDPSRRVELVLRLVAREDEEDLIFPNDECKPLSTLYPPAVPE